MYKMKYLEVLESSVVSSGPLPTRLFLAPNESPVMSQETVTLPELQSYSGHKAYLLEERISHQLNMTGWAKQLAKGSKCISKFPTFQKCWVSQPFPSQHVWQIQIHRKTHLFQINEPEMEGDFIPIWQSFQFHAVQGNSLLFATAQVSLH